MSATEHHTDHSPTHEPILPTHDLTLAERSGQRHPPCLLIIEDSPSIRQFYSIILAAEGYRMLLAENGAMGLELALRLAPDLLLVDLILPDINGLDTLRALRTAEHTHQRPPIPALLLTALDAPQDNDLAALGIAALLDKAHLTPATLVRTVRQVLTTPW